MKNPTVLLTLTTWSLLFACKNRTESESLTKSETSGATSNSIQIILQDALPRIGGLNPYATNNAAVHSIARFVYEPLAVYQTDDPFTEEPRPLLAEKIEFDDFAKSLTITLRQGIQFQDLTAGVKSDATSNGPEPGEAYELTSDDVEFSLIVAANLRHNSSHTWLQGANLRVVKLDKYKLKVFWNPNKDLTAAKNSNYVIAYKILSTLILPRRGVEYDYHFDWSSPASSNFVKALKKSFIDKTMWGTGPYQFAAKSPGLISYPSSGQLPGYAVSYALEKNRNYWSAQDAERLNTAARLPLSAIQLIGKMPNHQDKLLHTRHSKLGIAHMSPEIGRRFADKPSRYSGVLAMPLTAKHTYHLMLSFHPALASQNKRQIMRSAYFRRALSQLIERQRITSGLSSMLKPANSFFGHGSYSDSVPITSDFAKGKLAIRDAGFHADEDTYQYVPGKYLNFMLNHSPYDESAQQIAYGLRQIMTDAGYRVAIPEFSANMQTRFDRSWRGDLIIRRIRNEKFPDPKIYWHSKGAANDTGFSDPEVDQIIDTIHSELDPSRFYGHYHKLDRMLKERMPSIPLLEVQDFVGLSPKMQLLINQNGTLLEDLIVTLNW